jgi:hypothetical protein
VKRLGSQEPGAALAARAQIKVSRRQKLREREIPHEHRVAHLIVSGADPRRILLMTFSRRAASEMSKRVERIARKVLGE